MVREAYYNNLYPRVPSKRLPIRPYVRPTLARSGYECDLNGEQNYNYVREKLEKYGIVAEERLQFTFNDETKNIFYEPNTIEILQKYYRPEYIDKLIYFTFRIENSKSAHVMGGLMFRNNLKQTFLFIFNGYYVEPEAVDSILETIKYFLQPISQETYIRLYPNVFNLTYAIQINWEKFKSVGECSVFAIIIPILMKSKVNFNVLKNDSSYLLSYLFPPLLKTNLETVLRQLDVKIEQVYSKSHNLTISAFNDYQREYGLLGGLRAAAT